MALLTRSRDHLAEECQDWDCPRFPCRLYHAGYDEGWRRGYDRGFSDGEAVGFAAGYAAGVASAAGGGS